MIQFPDIPPCLLSPRSSGWVMVLKKGGSRKPVKLDLAHVRVLLESENTSALKWVVFLLNITTCKYVPCGKVTSRGGSLAIFKL